MRDSDVFDKAVKTFFEPIAQKLALPLSKVREGVYEIPSPYFIMRVRLDTGHARGLNVILRPASAEEFDENKPGVQYGIGCFMEFRGEQLERTFIDVDTDADFLEQARLLALAAERHCVPYLLGKGKDLAAIREGINKKTAADLEEIKKYRFPTNVREEWTVPDLEDENQ